jgi:nicotinamidase-related amidase
MAEGAHMRLANTAVVLVGFQNEYFAEDGKVRGLIDDPIRADQILAATQHLIDALMDTETMFITTPMTIDATTLLALDDHGVVGQLASLQAFSPGTPGAEEAQGLHRFANRIVTIPGKRGMNGFHHSALEEVLRENDRSEVVLAGALTSLCIDSTARAAYEKGFHVTILSDCVVDRSAEINALYCSQILPLYADVCTSTEFLDQHMAGSTR